MPNAPASPSHSPVLAFIGGGNMARSLIGGLIARGADPARLRVAEPVPALREALARDFGVPVFDSGEQAVQGAQVWLLAVKPQVMREVCASLAAQARAQAPLAISIAAGITAGQLDRWLGGGAAVVRAMPNTPALLGAGITGLYANDAARPRFDQAAELLSAVGPTVRIDDEAQMDAVTAVSGSGPAYLFLLAEAMQQAGEAQGLDADAARALVVQTLLGAATMLQASDEPAATLRARVTSPGGTTQAAVETFEAGGLRELVGRAIAAATERGRQLSAANE
ncbi:pyrroline-5-carboxylate reductase [Lysobacter enzymogenes]|uniref:pyrroline-5-carboxylate reductase n=1 Tax=Lysobacter enzymogenes TaxID=69 RepID=UPI0033965AF5